MPDVRNLVTHFGAETKDFVSGAEAVKQQLTTLNKEFAENKKAMKECDSEIKAVEKAMKELDSIIKQSGGGNAALNAQYDEMRQKLDALNLKKAQLKTNEQDLKGRISNTTAELKKQNSELKDTSAQSETASKSIGNLGTALKALVFGYTGKKLYESLIGSNSEMEQYITNFKVILGSADEAQKLVKDLTSMAAKTPLQLTDLTGTANMLLSYGVQKDELISTMTKLGDLSAGNAEKLSRVSLAYGQMLAKGKVSGEELRQMTEAGVPLMNALAESMSVSGAEFSKMISAGKVGIPELNKAISDLTGEGGKFNGMMAEQSKTMNGMLSTIKDNMTQFGRDVGEDAFKTVKDSVSELLQMINEANSSGEMKSLANNIGSSIGTVANALAGAIKIAWEFRGAIAAGATAVASYKAITSAVDVIGTLVTVTKTATGTQIAFNAACDVNPYVLLASALVAVSGALIAFSLNADTASNNLRAYNKEMEEAKERGEQIISSGETEIAQVKLKAEVYEQLRSKVNRTAEEENNLKQVATELQAIMPNGISLIDAETGAYNALGNSLDNVIAKMRAKILLDAHEEEYKTAVENVAQITEKRDTAQAQLDRQKELLPKIEENYSKGLGVSNSLVANTKSQINRLEKEIEKYNAAIAESEAAMSQYESEYLDYYGVDINSEEKTSTKNQWSFDKSKVDERARSQFDSAYKDLKYNLDMDVITQSEYYDQLEQLLKSANAEGLADYRQYYTEIYKGRKSLGEQSAKEYEKALTEQEKLEKQELDNYVKESKSAYEENLKNRKSAIEEYYKAKKELAEEEYKNSVNAVENELKALEKSNKAKIKLIEEEKEAEKEKLQLKMDAIDKEIEARKRLQEDTDINREIDAVKAKLTYSQLDDFSREEFEKELRRLVAEKEETAWQRSKADEKTALKEQMSGLDSDYTSQKEQLEDEIDAAKEIAEIRKESLKEHREEILATLETEKDTLIQTLETEQTRMEQTFAYIGENFNSLAELHSNRIEDVFNVAVRRSKEAIIELQSATNYASHLAEQIIADIRAAQSSGGTTSYNTKNTSVANNFYSANLTESQVKGIVADALGD